MPNSFLHPFRIDDATLNHAGSKTNSNFLEYFSTPGLCYKTINPIIFTHAYTLLGTNSQRFTSDLSLYLATVRCFFERYESLTELQLPNSANADAKKRLSEDLGVAMAAYFMVEFFDISWDTISQIPVNSNLSKKRPDFLAFTPSQEQYLFEAKGTTNIKSIENILSKALDQVKNYPSNAAAKIAIVTYLSSDKRFFPSHTFVVDPPASIPDFITPNMDNSRLLHFEKVLQFAGFPETASLYLKELSSFFREQNQTNSRKYRNEESSQRLMDKFNEERERNDKSDITIEDIEFIGRYIISEDADLKLFFGASRKSLLDGLRFMPSEFTIQNLQRNEEDIYSIFTDGTILYATRRA